VNANWETARWIAAGLVTIGGGLGLLTGRTGAGAVALAAGVVWLGWLGRERRPVVKRYVPKPKTKTSRKGAKTQRRKAA
jgi:hypothetical protein